MTSPSSIGMDTVVVQTENLLTSKLDGETVLMSLQRAAYFGLESTGQHIWNLIAQPTRVADLCEQLVADYEVERKDCEQHVCAFLKDMNDEGLIRIV